MREREIKKVDPKTFREFAEFALSNVKERERREAGIRQKLAGVRT